MTFALRNVNIDWITNQPITVSDLLPAVLLNALRQYSSDASPLWRMADGKDHVKIEVTFRKATNKLSTRRGPKAGGGLHPLLASGLASLLQPDDRRPTTTTPTRRPTLCMEKETPPPPSLTLTDTTRSTITLYRTQKTAIIEPSPTIIRPPTPPPTPDSPPKKKTRTQWPTAPASKEKCPTSYISYEFSYPLHEKYNLQGVINVKMMDADVMIVKNQRLQCSDETINIDLPAVFMYHLNTRYKKWIVIKRLNSKYYIEHICEHIETELETGDGRTSSHGTTALSKPATIPGHKYISTGWQTTSRSTRPLKKTPCGIDLLRMRTPFRLLG